MRNHLTAPNIIPSSEQPKAIPWQAIAVVALLVILLYAAIICVPLFAYKADIKDVAAAAGQAGDFIGGLLNPVVALAALTWLATSVSIQRTELTESRKALAEAAAAQNASAGAQAAQVQLSALTASLTAASQEEQVYLTRLTYYVAAHDRLLQSTQRVYGLDGRELARKEDIIESIKFINGKIAECVQRQIDLRNRIERYLLRETELVSV